MKTTQILCGLTLMIIGGLVLACGLPDPALPTPTIPHFPTDTPESRPTSSLVEPPRTPAPSPLTGEQVIRYRQSGGLTGVSEVLEIGPNGEARVIVWDGLVGTTILPPDRLAQLQAQLMTIQFFELHDTYNISGKPMTDEVVKTLSYTQNGKTKQVQVARDDRQVASPPDLDNLINSLDHIIYEIRLRNP